MNQKLLKRVTFVVVVSSVVLIALAGLLYGLDGVLGASAGAVVANLNWQAIRWLTERVTAQEVRSKGRLMVLATLKTTSLMAVCWLALTQVGLDSRSFIIGISALVVGVLVGPLSLSEALSETSDPSDVSSPTLTNTLTQPASSTSTSPTATEAE